MARPVGTKPAPSIPMWSRLARSDTNTFGVQARRFARQTAVLSECLPSHLCMSVSISKWLADSCLNHGNVRQIRGAIEVKLLGLPCRIRRRGEPLVEASGLQACGVSVDACAATKLCRAAEEASSVTTWVKLIEEERRVGGVRWQDGAHALSRIDHRKPANIDALGDRKKIGRQLPWRWCKLARGKLARFPVAGLQRPEAHRVVHDRVQASGSELVRGVHRGFPGTPPWWGNCGSSAKRAGRA